MNYFALVFFLVAPWLCKAQVQIPAEMDFAGIRLKLSEPVRRALKADVELITKNAKYFQVKVERADIYFPMIEKIFREEGFPEDFKYLALQESSLVADAVSSSNAVGYWQFKKETAQEVGLRVDNVVDERRNIAASSRGAMAYLKKNNVILNNWIYALLSYNLGLGGVKSHVKEKYRNATIMPIDEDMHWYVIRFLAHKLAYEHAIGKKRPAVVLLEEKSRAGNSLSQLAQERKIDQNLLTSYNLWLFAGHAPTDRKYSFILPVDSGRQVAVLEEPVKEVKIKENHHEVKVKTETQAKPKIKNYQDIAAAKTELEKIGSDVPLLVTINKVRAIQAVKGDDVSRLALRAGIRTVDFLFYNDLRKFDPIVPGAFYYLQPKKNKALVLKHTVEPGEDMASISQKYGIKQNAIRKKNRMDKRESLVPGRVIWLRMKRPKNSEPEYVKIPEPEKKIIKEQEVKKDTVQAIKISSPDTLSDKGVRTDKVVDRGQVHMVKAGETLYSISKTYGVQADSIRKWNSLPDNNLKPGQELLVKPAVKSSVVHKVVQGETLYKIARMYGVTPAEIRQWNGKTGDALETGEELIIKRR